MANHFRLYSRPLMADDEVLPPLSITGVVNAYTPGSAYETRLQIINGIGRCTVEVLEQSLPGGATVRVDNITKEVVIKWPAFVEVVAEETLLPNGGFESGDDGTWHAGPGWSIGSGSGYDVHGGSFSARFANVKTKGSDLFSPLIPAKVNDYIRVKGYIQQGASSKGNAGARVVLSYHDKDGKELQYNLGNLVTSGKNGSWNTSVAEGAAPKDTASVMVRFSAYRNKENHPLWVDDITWNHKYTLGTNTDPTYYVRLRVTDSLNRQAEWAGVIPVAQVMLFSQLYGYYAAEGIDSNLGFALGDLKEQPAFMEGVDSGMSVASTWALTLAVRPYSSRPEGINSTFRANTGWTLVTSVKSANVYPEGVNSGASIPTTWVQFNAQIIAGYPAEGITTGMTVRPWSKS